MTRDDIIRMAREAGMATHLGHTDDDGKHHPAVNALKTSVPVEWLERFAALVAAAEREACAQVCDELHSARSVGGFPREASASRHLAFAIRQRGAA